MKNRDFGESGPLESGPLGWGQSAEPNARVATELCFHCIDALKDYRNHRENGNELDSPSALFPSSEFDKIDIDRSCQGANKWPDLQDRYWWKITLNPPPVSYDDIHFSSSSSDSDEDGAFIAQPCEFIIHREPINDFYWEKDEKRGWPDKTNTNLYWFTICNENAETRIEGFLIYRKDEAWHIGYQESGDIKKWMEEKDLNYLDRIQSQSPLVYAREEDAHRDIYKRQLARQDSELSTESCISIEVMKSIPGPLRWSWKENHTISEDVVSAINTYREKHENESLEDTPDYPFPDGGLSELIINSSNRQDLKWPDLQGRYWWQLTLGDGRIVNDFYWMEDKVYKDAKGEDVYRYIVYHAPSSTAIGGFSHVPHHQHKDGFPDKFYNYHYILRYNECGDIKKWREEKDLNYLDKIQSSWRYPKEVAEEYARQYAIELAAHPDIQERQSARQHARSCTIKTRNWGHGMPRNQEDNVTTVACCIYALQNYRENRENGTYHDTPGSFFPSGGFDELDIKHSSRQSKWPDAQSRYWWKLTLEGGGTNEDFYWTKDTVRGYPDTRDKNGDRYWFIIHNDETDTHIEGFSEGKEEDGYWYTKYTECAAVRDWMKEKDLNYFDRIQKQNFWEYAIETAAHPDIEKRQSARQEKWKEELEKNIEIEESNLDAQCRLGYLYERLSPQQNYTKSKEWYEKAANKGHVSSQLNLGELYMTVVGSIRDYKSAYKWSEEAYTKGKKAAGCNMGILYAYIGKPLQLKEAVKLYVEASKDGYPLAQILLGVCYVLGDVGFDADFASTEHFFLGAKTAKKEYQGYSYKDLLALFEEFSKEYTSASLLLAIVHEYGLLNIKRDMEASIKFYRFAIDSNKDGNKDGNKNLIEMSNKATIKWLKRLATLAVHQDKTAQNKLKEEVAKHPVSIEIMNAALGGIFYQAVVVSNRSLLTLLCTLALDVIDTPNASDGDTALHLAIKRDQIELAKILILHGANLSVRNLEGKTPALILIDKGPSYFLHKERKQLLALTLAMMEESEFDKKIGFPRDIVQERDVVIKIGRLFLRPAALLVNRQIDPTKIYYELNEKAFKDAFKELGKLPHLAPLLKITAFAVEGLHKLASQMPAGSDKKLKIILDPCKEHVSDAALHDFNADVVGVYYRDNAIYLCGNRANDAEYSRELLHGTLIHEVTHFIAHEVFQNDANPYIKGDKRSAKLFEDICDRIYKIFSNSKGPRLIPDYIERVFSYDKSQWHSELIVRVPQMIAMGRLGEIEKFCPDLLTYFNTHFLGACQMHILELHYTNNVFMKSAIERRQARILEVNKEKKIWEIGIEERNSKFPESYSDKAFYETVENLDDSKDKSSFLSIVGKEQRSPSSSSHKNFGMFDMVRTRESKAESLVNTFGHKSVKSAQEVLEEHRRNLEAIYSKYPSLGPDEQANEGMLWYLALEEEDHAKRQEKSFERINAMIKDESTTESIIEACIKEIEEKKAKLGILPGYPIERNCDVSKIQTSFFGMSKEEEKEEKEAEEESPRLAPS